jgi:hypothetical protein
MITEVNTALYDDKVTERRVQEDLGARQGFYEALKT